MSCEQCEVYMIEKDDLTDEIKELKKQKKETEAKVVEIIEDCKLYRDTFILKKQLIRKLEEAFPEK